MRKIYSHNWYNRNNVTYTYGNPVDLTRKYSSQLYSLTDVQKMLNNLTDLNNELQDLIKFRFSKKVKVSVSNTSDNTYTDGKRIVVSNTREIKDEFERMDLLFGLTFHEVSHCLYTDFNEINSKNIYKNSILKFIHNVLEDEEIENRLIKNNKGYGPYIAKVKEHLFGDSSKIEKGLNEEKKNNLDLILSILFCIVRCPEHLSLFNDEVLEKYEDLFIKINDILVNSECPAVVPFTECSLYEESYYDKLSITNSTVKASFEIYKYLTEYLQEDFEEMKKECEEDDSFVSKSETFNIPTSIGEDDPAEISQKISDEFGDSNCITMIHDEIYSGADTDEDLSTKKDIVRTPNPEKYNKFYADVSEYKQIVERTIIPNSIKVKDNLVINRFRRNGNLDTNRLAEAMQDINTIYTQRFNRPTKVNNEEPKYAFVIMIDESGSMQTFDKKNEFAFKVAILFNEVLSKFKGIEMYVYGHGDKINPYITKEHKNKFVLANFDKQGGQNEVKAYPYIINDVKRQTNLPIVILNITDFYYHSSDTNMEKMFKELSEGNVSFNMLCIANQTTRREEQMCKRILNGGVISLTDVLDKNKVKTALIELAELIKSNYNKFNHK